MVERGLPTPEVALAMSPSAWLRRLGFEPYAWQEDALSVRSGNLVINGARQAGKSTIISCLPAWTAKYKAGSLSIVMAPTLAQAEEDFAKMMSFVRTDPQYPPIKRANSSEMRLSNGSRVLVLPATDSARGYSGPDLVILDEASRIDKEIYTSVVLPYFIASINPLFVRISTPNGRTGTFWDDWTDKNNYRIKVTAPFRVDPYDATSLLDAELMQEEGIHCYHSPQHRDKAFQLLNLRKLGRLQYQQEMLGEFVEPEDSVFSYSDIEAMFGSSAAPLNDEGIGWDEAPKEDFAV